MKSNFLPFIVSLALLVLYSCGKPNSNDKLPIKDSSVPKHVSQLKWKYSTKRNVNGLAADDSKAYASLRNGTVVAVDIATGTVVWSFETNDRYYNDNPVITEDLMFIGCKNRVYAINKQNGWEVWQTPYVSAEFSEPLYHQEVLYVSNTDGDVMALDAQTGNVIWQNKVSGQLRRKAQVKEDIVVFSDERNIFFFKKNTGELALTFPESGKEHNVIVGENLILQDSRRIRAISIKEGVFTWEFKTEDDMFKKLTSRDGIIYVAAGREGLFAIESSTGKKLWNFNPEGNLHTTPYTDGKVVLVGTQKDRLYALDASSGKELWRYVADDRLYTSPVVSNGVVIIGCESGNIYALQ